MPAWFAIRFDAERSAWPGVIAALWLCVLCAPIFGFLQSAEAQGEAHADGSTLVQECGSCHRGHGEPGTPMLRAGGSEACLLCHQGDRERMRGLVAPFAMQRLTNIAADFEKPYSHPLETARYHRGDEVLPETSPNAPRHVSCVDCHDAHRTIAVESGASAFNRQRGATKREIAYEYQLCYRCHGDSANLPFDARNIRLEMYPGNPSYHPVEARGQGMDVPSLINPLTESSLISCTDCHRGENSRDKHAPHGSIYAGLLSDNYTTKHGQMESGIAYALCYRCHSRSSILSGESFGGHSSHLQDADKRTSCFTCHNSHGSRENAHLIEFNPVIVRAAPSGRMEYVASGQFSGQCYLTCHVAPGKDAIHDPASYCPTGGGCTAADNIGWLSTGLPQTGKSVTGSEGSEMLPPPDLRGRKGPGTRLPRK